VHLWPWLIMPWGTMESWFLETSCLVNLPITWTKSCFLPPSDTVVLLPISQTTRFSNKFWFSLEVWKSGIDVFSLYQIYYFSQEWTISHSPNPDQKDEGLFILGPWPIRQASKVPAKVMSAKVKLGFKVAKASKVLSVCVSWQHFQLA